MTNEEARDLITDYMIDEFGCADLNRDALKMAVKALNLRAKISSLGDDVIVLPKHGTWVINGVDVHEAIEKQIPKPQKVYDAHPRDICLCPVCSSTFIERGGAKMNYCPNCGQAIDWLEVEE